MVSRAWPLVSLGDVLRRVKDEVIIDDSKTYTRLTIRLNGKGIVVRDSIVGADIGTKRQFIARAGQLVLSKIDALNGAFGILPSQADNAIITGNFWAFDHLPDRLELGFLEYLTKTEEFLNFCRRSSEGTTNRKYLQEPKFLSQKIPLPSLDEQKRIVGNVDRVVHLLGEAKQLADECESLSSVLLSSFFNRIANGATRRQLGDVAPLNRRPAIIDVNRSYPQVSVRSFGRGTFHNPPMPGSEITWQKPHLVKEGDILVSNIKAWEGAIAVAGENDSDRYGSHRYLTFVPIEKLATADFLCFYLLSPEGLFHIGEASPGSADRNRTLNAKKMLKIPVPIPRYEDQVEFDELLRNVRCTSEIRLKATTSREALLPSILDRAFKGEL